jgi:hypothetical protein
VGWNLVERAAQDLVIDPSLEMCVDCTKAKFDKAQSKLVGGRTDLASGLWTSTTRPGKRSLPSTLRIVGSLASKLLRREVMSKARIPQCGAEIPN